MYMLNDTVYAIREVQRFLLAAAQSDERIPQSPIDGIYGDETRTAVTVFQDINGLPKSGEVDLETFKLLYIAHKDREAALKASYERYENAAFPLEVGAFGPDIAHLHVILSELSQYYEIEAVPRGDFFTKETEDAVKLMQGIFLYPESGTVDEILFKRLDDEALFRKKLKP